MKVTLFALLLCACASTGQLRATNTIRVVNNSIDTLAIYERGMRIGTVGPGESVCLRIRQPSNTVLTATAVGGGSTTSLSMDTWQYSWEWTVNRVDSIDSIATAPAHRC